jgi:hypothetical protein
VGSPEIRLGRGISLCCVNLHQKIKQKRLVSIRKHPWVLGQATGTSTHKIHHGPDSGEATTFPHIVLFTARSGGYIQMAQILGTPEMESRNCPGWTSRTLRAHNSRLQSSIAPRSKTKL